MCKDKWKKRFKTIHPKGVWDMKFHLFCLPFYKLIMRCIPILLFLLSLCFSIQSSGQAVRINEIMSSNSSYKADEDGDFSDWIELFNTSPDTVRLAGWGLSDDKNKPYKWIFPDVKIAPGGYLVVWASGKDYKPSEGEWIHGVMREVYPNIPGTGISALTQHLSYPDVAASRQIMKDYFEAPVDEANNYGQRMQCYLKAPVSGWFTFWISSDDNGQLWISDNETGFNFHLIAEVPGWNYPREWNKYSQQRSTQIYLEKGNNYYLRALAKEETGGDNLAVGWEWPDGTLDRPISGQYLYWPYGELHTNFNISSGGEVILLTNPQGVRVDEISPVAIPADISYGRIPGGNPELVFFTQPSPGKQNGASGFSEILQPPVFSHPGGFYQESFNLILSPSKPGVSIVYTLDGSIPDINNLSGSSYSYKDQYQKNPGSSAGTFLYRTYKTNLYSVPLNIRDRTSDANQISRISTTYDSSPWYAPSDPIDKAVVVKARTVKQGALSSEVVTHTYFVRSGEKNPYPLPVISFSTQEDLLFDFNKGIYVAGADFEKWRASNPATAASGGSNANYYREGDNWEYPGSIELFDYTGNCVFAQNIGFRIHGNWSNAHPFKSLRIYARNSYGAQFMNYPFFRTEEEVAFKRIILRNSGNDIWYTMFRDAAMQEMVSHLNFETQAYQPSILFLNGEYWGIHNIRERIDKYYLAGKFGVDEEQVDILENNMSVDEGENQHYTETIDYITRYGVTLSAAYEYIKTRIDVTSYIDYMIAQIFMVNTDWPGNNIKYWRLQTPEYLSGSGAGKDGRWRWILYDADFTFGIYTASEYSYNMMTFVTRTDGPSWPNPPWSTFLFRKLLENESFKTDFIVRFCDQLNTAFKPGVVKSIIDKMQTTITPEMSRHIQRWKMPSSLSNWYSNVNQMRNFAELRPAYARVQLRNFFYLSNEYTLTINVSGKNQGYVVVNTVTLQNTTRGVDTDPYPWQGTYFSGVPLRLEAVPAPGFEFVRWESGSSSNSTPVLNLKPYNNQNFTAVFQKSDKTDELVHYWNFNAAEKLLSPTYTLLTAGFQIILPPEAVAGFTSDSGQNFTAANARFNDPAESHLRVNNPLGVKLIFDLPTTGFSAIKFAYETRRSGQGAGTQVVEYSTNGTDFIIFRRLTVKDENPELVAIDFSSIVAVNDNPDFKIRISFETGNGGTSGNNRLDNITMEGIPDVKVSVPQEMVFPEEACSLKGEVFPNPFRTFTSLQLFLKQPEYLRIGVYDMSHKKVLQVYEGFQTERVNSFHLDGSALIPGVYLLICETGSDIFRQKLVKY
jgi:hypothetical protein